MVVVLLATPSIETLLHGAADRNRARGRPRSSAPTGALCCRRSWSTAQEGAAGAGCLAPRGRPQRAGGLAPFLTQTLDRSRVLAGVASRTRCSGSKTPASCSFRAPGTKGWQAPLRRRADLPETGRQRPRRSPTLLGSCGAARPWATSSCCYGKGRGKALRALARPVASVPILRYAEESSRFMPCSVMRRFFAATATGWPWATISAAFRS